MKMFRSMLLAALGALVLVLLATSYASAASRLILKVNSTADTDDGNCNMANCTLREAINASNASTGVTDTIAFAISGGGVRSIRPTTALPALTDTVIIDGYTQPGSSTNTLALGDNAVLRIELSGQRAPASTDGLTLSADNIVVRGLVINRWSDSGLLVFSDFNTIEGNFIGTNAAGTAPRPNADGINLCSGSIKNLVGGTTVAARNLISGNTYSGIMMSRCSTPTEGDTIQGNYIGTDATGTLAMSNGTGISLSGTAHVVGGLNAAARNVISGNSYGVIFFDATDSAVSANFIGTQADGKHALPNNTGIYLWGSSVGGYSSGNTIGGDTKPEANRIAFNSGPGVVVGSAPGTGDAKNRVARNSMFSNGSLGIDLANNGVTANDAADGDTGPNLLQNFPVLKRATSSARKIKGNLRSAANTLFTLEFFKSPACDASGNGEGKKFLGRATVMTDVTGVAHFSLNVPKGFAVGNAITATATDPDGNTSEFSRCRTAS